jgi:glutamate-5-semialdehyde dehydrogenase
MDAPVPPFDVVDACRRAKRASRAVAALTPAAKAGALRAVARALREAAPALDAANRRDLARAREAGVSAALVDRLALGPDRLEALARSVEAIAAQPDPVGQVLGLERRPNGLLAGQMRVPLGVVAMIYEARPNVTVEAAALALKAGNASLLRGGSDAAHSNEALGRVLAGALAASGVPADAALVLPPLDREATRALLGQTGLVDLVIPRGGEGLIRFVTEHARVPVIQHFKGVCHLYADEGCDPAAALALVENGKAQRPGTCNATECLLAHGAAAAALLPRVAERLGALGVELRACPRALALMPGARPAAPDDWGREFLDLVLAVRVVDSFDEALDHVARYGSGHTEAICTSSYERAQRWVREVDASCVIVNASTRFNDGGELGLGAEVGISTSKLHAYGPMGAEHLTTRKWVLYGEGQIRS